MADLPKNPFGREWGDAQSAHALAVARYGDRIFDEVQKGAKELENAWEKQTRKWNKLIDKAVRGKWLGLGPPIVDRRWLSHVLFQPTRVWPNKLSEEEVQLLELAKAASSYHPLHAQGVVVDTIRGDTRAPKRIESDAATLKVLQKYASLFKRDIAMPMWRSYNKVSDEYTDRVKVLCDEKYDEPCTTREAEKIFKGDLQRGWKMKTLDVSPDTYRTFPAFITWIVS
jgi:hypothetical protein